jgi:hypothetical protein
MCWSSRLVGRWFTKEGECRVGEDNSEGPCVRARSQAKGTGRPLPVGWWALLPAQVVASLLQTFHHDNPPLTGISCPNRIKSRNGLRKSLCTVPSPLGMPQCSPSEYHGRPCCQTRAWVVPDTMSCELMIFIAARACVNPAFCPYFPSTSAQTASSPKS